MGRYVDGFVIPIAKDKVDEYQALVQITAQVWKDHGAAEYWECIGDDLESQTDDGPKSFLQMAGASNDETVVFAWVVFESRQQRDEANAKIMADPRLSDLMKPENQLFDCKRMAFGGFQVLIEA